MRPCTCDRIVHGSKWTADQCRTCWLFHHAPAKNKEWGGDGLTHAVPSLTAEDIENRMRAQWSRPVLKCAVPRWKELGLHNAPGPRVGTHLKSLLEWFHIKSSNGCGCATRAAMMNARGIAWCRENKEMIVGWMEEAAKERGVPFIRSAGYLVLDQALANAQAEFDSSPIIQGSFSETTPAEEFARSFLEDRCPGWPKAFVRWPNAIDGFRLAFTQAVARAPLQPKWAHKRGIAICGGGRKFFPGAYVACRAIRELGCNWPIELWHLGPKEREPEMDELLTKIPGVTWRDSLAVADSLGMRCSGGWESKAFALAYSDFQETVLIDADCYPAFNPEELLSQEGYQKTGAVFWPDHSDFKPEQYDFFGVPRNPENMTLESGQLVVDKARHWLPTWLAVWLNHNSAFVYRFIYGDKDTFMLAWQKAGHEFVMPTRRPEARHGSFLQKDFLGRVFFVHRSQAKFSFQPWGRKHGWRTAQIGIAANALPGNAIAERAIQTGDTYLSPPLPNEPWLLDVLPKVGRTAIDVGANVGLWSVALKKQGFRRVLAIEPNPAAFRQISFLPLAIESLNAAAWSEPGAIELHDYDDHRATTIMDHHPWAPSVSKGTIKVPAIRLDDLDDGEVDFVKIDTEGAEVEVLRGAMGLLSRNHPALLVECHGHDKRLECERIMNGLGYAVRHIPHPHEVPYPSWLFGEKRPEPVA